jgi:hypothetical protein
MKVQGSNCSIVIKTTHSEMNVPYTEETIREAVSLLHEEPAIEGDGIKKAIRKARGVTGCIVTPLTIETAPLLFFLTMGSAVLPLFVSETRNIYHYRLELLPMEDSASFNLLQDRTGNSGQKTVNTEMRLFECCAVKGFELRIVRDETIKLKLDITSECTPVSYPYNDI